MTRRGYREPPRPRSAMARADQNLRDAGSLAKHGLVALVVIFLAFALLPSACRAATDAGVVDPAVGGFGAGAAAGAGGAAAAAKLKGKLGPGGGGGGGGGAAATGGAAGAARRAPTTTSQPPPETTTTRPSPPTTQPPPAPPRISERPLERPVMPQGGGAGNLRPPDDRPGAAFNPVIPGFQTQ